VTSEISFEQDPALILNLLRRFEWVLISGSSEDPYEVWRNDLVSANEILLPTDPRKADYQQLLRRAYRTLAYEHGAEIDRAANSISLQRRSLLDVTRWSKETSLATGMIQWDAGQALHVVARTSLAVAAKATHKPRRYYGNSSAYISKKFIDATLMGQTEPGSYIVTAYSPSGERFFVSRSNEEASASKLVDVESKTGAEIIDKLDDIVRSVRGKLDEYRSDPRTTIFEEIAVTGFSYEIAHALAALSENGDGVVRITRANARTGNEISNDYEFTSTESPVLERVSESLRQTAEPEAVTLVGEVTLLEHISNVDTHTVRLHVANQARLRTVRMNLTSDQYQAALEAHRSDSPLQVRGMVERQGKYNWLRDPEQVRMLGQFSNDDDVPEDAITDVDEPDADQDSLF